MDHRMQKIALGPVVIFGASNFPIAYSVAGGDTASTLAAGCTVVLKAHNAHPGASEIMARAIRKAVQDSGLHQGVFSMVRGAGNAVGEALVDHPLIKACMGLRCTHTLQRKNRSRCEAAHMSLKHLNFAPGLLNPDKPSPELDGIFLKPFEAHTLGVFSAVAFDHAGMERPAPFVEAVDRGIAPALTREFPGAHGVPQDCRVPAASHEQTCT
jgi:Aldehyde dehydrogenase family